MATWPEVGGSKWIPLLNLYVLEKFVFFKCDNVKLKGRVFRQLIKNLAE